MPIARLVRVRRRHTAPDDRRAERAPAAQPRDRGDRSEPHRRSDADKKDWPRSPLCPLITQRDLELRRGAVGEATTRLFVGLQPGEVLSSHDGGGDRLDLMRLGPAANEAARLGRIRRCLEQPLIALTSFAAEAAPPPARPVSLGRYALRGGGRPQAPVTLDPDQLQAEELAPAA